MLHFNENVLTILRKRYFAKDPQGNIVEDWEKLCNRVATAVSKGEPDADAYVEKFYDMIYNLEFLPNSPTLFNAGLPLGQLAACFVLPIADSMEGIFDTLKKAALVFASGGGCGYNFSTLRRKGAPVSRTFGESSGPVSFMQVFDAATEVIKQGGRRKGANMGILDISHPDIEEFMDAKKKEGCLSNFNISVAVTDDFMNAVVEDGSFDLIDNYKKCVYKTVKASDLFSKIVSGLWLNGEPGVIFIDTINRHNPLPSLGRITATNPCSEQPLLPYESCTLGSINLVKCTSGKLGDSISNFNWEKLAELVKWAVRFLDCVLSVNKSPVKEIYEASIKTRKIGLGVMGLADVFLICGIRYDSDEALAFAEKLMEFITFHAYTESVALAEKWGPFPAIDQYVIPEKIKKWPDLCSKIQSVGLRNATLTTIAPTGSLSLIAGVSSSIEPNFQWQYSYHRVDSEFSETHPLASSFIKNGQPLPEYFVTALDIAPEWHVRMQATFQKWVDSGISKTINMPNDATMQDVYNAVITAWKLGCKGITIYRTGSRQEEVLVKQDSKVQDSVKLHPRRRPEVTLGKTIQVPVGNCGHLYVTVNSDEEGPCEVFISLGKSGGCLTAHAESLGRVISAALRSGVDVQELIEQLSNIRCSKTVFHSGTTIKSCADGVAYALKKALDVDVQKGSVIDLGSSPECPECGANLKREGKCLSCTSCGFSQCV